MTAGFFSLSSLHQSAPSLFLKSNFEYLRGNYRKAVKLLNSSNIAEHPGPIKTGDQLVRVSLWTSEAWLSSETLSLPVLSPSGECVRCMFWNNLGCIHFAMGKHNLGIFYFKKALQENDHTCAQLGDGSNGQCESASKNPQTMNTHAGLDSTASRSIHSSDERSLFIPTPLCTCCLFFFSLAKKFTGIPMCALLATKRYELLYNCGIQLLHIGRPLAAFECLMEAVQVYHSNPRLWLRLAECCISANKGVRLSPHPLPSHREFILKISRHLFEDFNVKLL